VFYSVILSGAKNLSFFAFLLLNPRAILRSAQNDRNGEFFRTKPHRPIPHNVSLHFTPALSFAAIPDSLAWAPTAAPNLRERKAFTIHADGGRQDSFDAFSVLSDWP
jgi:hypothetical protein